MNYIFLDESGDLGFDFLNKKVSKFFVITCIFVEDLEKNNLEKIVKKTIAKINKFSRKKAKISSLHFYKEKIKTRNKFLELLNQREISVLSVFIDKKQVSLKLRNNKHFIYNEMTKIILDKVYEYKNFDKIEISASRRETCCFLNKSFCEYLENNFADKTDIKIKVSIDLPHKEKCLQVADALSWTIFNKLEFNNDCYFKIIENKIKIEKIVFK